MARTFRAPPTYIKTLEQNGAYQAPESDRHNASRAKWTGGNSVDTQANYDNAVTQRYAAGPALTSNGATSYGQTAYDPRQAASYARQTQQGYQGGQPAVSSQELGQTAYDQSQRNNLQAVGGQRGSGGQSQGLRAAMMGTTAGASQQANAGMSAQQEQVAQRQAILQQRMASEATQKEHARNWQEEKDRFSKEKTEKDAETQAGMVEMAGTYSGMSMMSDERTKNVKKRKAPKLVIMLGGG
jgi:hypothetical protein